jgi:Tol biopolymer transport system component
MLWLAALVATLAAGAAGTWWLKPLPAVRHLVTRFTVPLPEGQAFTNTGNHVLAISPDGRRVVYVANQQLYLRDLDALTSQPIPGTNHDPSEPAFSPDGQWIAYFVPRANESSKTLVKVPISGGTPVTLGSTGKPYGLSWSGHTLVFGQDADGTSVRGIQAVDDAGGSPRTLLTAGEQEHVFQPQLLEDGQHVVFSMEQVNQASYSYSDSGDQIVVDAIGGGHREVLVHGTNPRVLAGRLVYYASNTIFAVPFDVRGLKLRGSAVQMVEGVRDDGYVTGAAQFAVADGGTLVFEPYANRVQNQPLVWVDRQGHEEAIDAPPHGYGSPRLSPDGTRLLVVVYAEVEGSIRSSDLWEWDFAHHTLFRLTSEASPVQTSNPVWSPDGREVFYRQNTAVPSTALWRIPADGTGHAAKVGDVQGTPYAAPDPRSLVYGEGGDLTLLTLTPSIQSRPLLQTKSSDGNAELSPDGHWLAYQSNASEPTQIEVRPFPDVDKGRWVISTAGGHSPLWSRDGREIFYIEPKSATLMAVPVHAGAAFSYGAPRPLFTVGSYAGSYDVSLDGKRFLMVKKPAAGAQEFVVVTHWLDELAKVK